MLSRSCGDSLRVARGAIGGRRASLFPQRCIQTQLARISSTSSVSPPHKLTSQSRRSQSYMAASQQEQQPNFSQDGDANPWGAFDSNGSGGGFGGGGFGGGGGGGFRGGGGGRYAREQSQGGGFGRGGGGGGRPSFENFADAFQMKELDWQEETLSTFRKNFYEEQASVKDRSQEDIQKFLSDAAMTRSGSNLPNPILHFNEAGFPESLLALVEKQGFPAPTPIQSQGWPSALSGRDLVGVSATGSGKTLGFVLPAIVHTLAQEPIKPGDGPIVLVLSPTRELCTQSMAQSEKYGRPVNVSSTAVYGGASRGPQERQLRRGVDMLFACPGRLLDFLETGATNLKRVTYLVLDEADRMLDMGFEPQIRKICSQIRPDRQTTMWSATWPPSVQNIARQFSADPVMITVGSTKLSANKKVTQVIHVLKQHEKLQKFIDVINEETQNPDHRLLVFANSKRDVDRLTRGLRQSGITALAIHGDKPQSERDYVMRQFREGRAKIVCATDVASRGIDVNDITSVVNFDFPREIEDYVHRIGRTARGGKTGRAISLFTEDMAKMAGEVERILREADQEVPSELQSMAKRNSGGYGGGRGGGGGYRGRGRGGGGGRERYGGSLGRRPLTADIFK